MMGFPKLEKTKLSSYLAQYFSRRLQPKMYYLLPQINYTFETNADFTNITFLMTLGTPPENPL